MAYVYFIKSISENYYYVGSSQDVAKRLAQHNNGEVKSTKPRMPYKLVYTEEYDTILGARMRERQIKNTRSNKRDIIYNIMALSSNG